MHTHKYGPVSRQNENIYLKKTLHAQALTEYEARHRTLHSNIALWVLFISFHYSILFLSFVLFFLVCVFLCIFSLCFLIHSLLLKYSMLCGLSTYWHTSHSKIFKQIHRHTTISQSIVHQCFYARSTGTFRTIFVLKVGF